MKTYDTYKETVSTFLPKIPNHWKKLRVKNLVDNNQYYPVGDGDHGSIKPSMYQDNGVPYIRVQNLSWDGKLDLSKVVYISEEIQLANKKSILKPGDILIAKTGATIGKLALISEEVEEANTTSSVGKLTVDFEKYDPKYILYCFQAKNFNDQIWLQASQKSAQPGFNIDDLIEFEITSPEIQEQTQIAKFLDHKTQIIDALIEKKEQLIKKLQAQRQAIINEAVTKGLNKNAKLKDSGIEWLGKIPEHWEVKRTKYLLNEKDGIKIGPFGSSLKLDTLVDKGIKIYGQGNVIKNDFKLGHRYLPFERFEESFQQYEILDGDILVTMMGTTGKSKVFNNSFERGILDSHLLRLRFDENLFNGDLFSIILQQADYIFQQISFNSVGSIMAGLNSAIIKKIKIITPPLDEQLKILKFIKDESNKIDLIISKSKTQIKKLKSYRQSIISEAVTGKIDVREWQAPKK
jgi:type I restriction enzyme S subunit